MKHPTLLLVNPWIHDFAAFDLWARPMGLLVFATRLRKLGWNVSLLDCLDRHHPEMVTLKSRSLGRGPFHRTLIAKPSCLETIPRTYARYGVDPQIVKRDLESLPVPAAILVTSLMTYWYTGVRETVQLLREVFPKVPILLGGIYASLLPEHAKMHIRADAILPGPAEHSIAEHLQRCTGIRPEIGSDSTGLEFTPALDLLRKVTFIPLLTSRGCPLRCTYCASRTLNSNYLQRPVEDVISELQDACLKYDVLDIALYDDAFLINAERHALPILDEIAERLPGLRIHAPNGLHATRIDSRVAVAMKKAGFETIRIGLESSSDEFHSRTGKKTDLQSFFSSVTNLRDAGFSREQIGVYLLVGVPGQSSAQIEEDVEIVLTAGAYPKLAEFSPIPGTLMWGQALGNSRYPLEEEPLFHNCTLLAAAEPDVSVQFIGDLRKQISSFLHLNQDKSSSSQPELKHTCCSH
ncbi:B12-binding domain-containing radical SAM protein [Desulfomonile tiedjei]|nr:radical SAM protein [Desulfomonile tiedjei]